MSGNNNEEKIWEKVWTCNDLQNFSTSWSLAGDAGLLLHLKQFSENLISKSVEVEKKLQKLIHEEKQCQIKLDNATSSFLILENSQFIENRVYEHELNETKTQDSTQVKSEKTKEEKEMDLFSKINEAVNVGMSIMDNYFDKLDPKEKNKELDDDDEEPLENEKINEDLIIYETKDPYVLRSLPYLIGSQAYLDNDHVGLRDLDSEDEDEYHEEEETETEESSDESRVFSDQEEEEKQKLSKDDDNSDSEEDLKTKPRTESKIKPRKPILLSESDEDDDDLFKSEKKEKNNLFDDDDEESEEDDNILEKKKPELKNKEDKDDKKEEDEDEEEEKNKPEPVKPIIDFAAELNSKLKAKKLNKIDKQEENNEEKQIPNVIEKKVSIVPKTKKLFDDEEFSSDENDLFSTEQTNKKAPVNEALFDENSDEKIKEKSDLFEIKKPEPSLMAKSAVTGKPDIKSALNDLFSKNRLANKTLFDSDDDEGNEDDDSFKNKLPSPEKNTEPVGKNKQETKATQPKKYSLFDDDDDDDEYEENNKKDLKKDVSPIKVQSSTIEHQQLKVKSLFDDDDDEDEDDLFKVTTSSKVKIQHTSNKNEKQSKKTSLFDSSDTSPESATVNLFENRSRSNTQTKQTETAKKTEASKKAKSLFNSSESTSDDKENDFFSFKKPSDNAAASKKIDLDKPSEKKLPVNKKIEKSFFDDDDDEDLLMEKKDLMPELALPIEKKNPPSIKEETKKKSLFDSSTEDETDDLFRSSSKQMNKESVKPSETAKTILTEPFKASENTKKATLFLSDEDSDDLFQTKQKNTETAPSIKQEDKPIKDIENKESVKPSIKNMGKNMLFNPNALESSSLFKKLADKSNIKSENEEEKENEKKNSLEENKDLLDIDHSKPAKNNFQDLFKAKLNESFSNSIKKKENETKSTPLRKDSIIDTNDNENDDNLFSNLKVDSAFSEQSLKNVQKDRIKVSAKKRAPISRRSGETVKNVTQELNNSILSDLIDSKPIEKSSISLIDPLRIDSDSNLNENKVFNNDEIAANKEQVFSDFENIDSKAFSSSETKITEKIETIKKPSLFDDFLEDDKLDDLDLFKPKNLKTRKERTSKIESIFDDDTDIFADSSLLISNKKDIKPKETQPKPKTSKIDDIFGDDDDEDIFKISSTKNN